MIDGVRIKTVTTRNDERGYFRELIRNTDGFFAEGFGQWSESLMYTGTIKAWHIHNYQVDWWYCSQGVIKAVLCDFQDIDWLIVGSNNKPEWAKGNVAFEAKDFVFAEYILGGHNDPIILKIPPGVAHGCKVLQGPAKLSYITSEVYNPDDEGRIAYDALGYDWFKREIT